MVAIHNITATSIEDSRGKKTVRVKVELEDGSVGEASVPSGASTGDREAVELRDADGKGVTKAVENVNTVFRKMLTGREATDQQGIDALMTQADREASQKAGREHVDNKGYYGANAILGVSLAVAHAAAKSQRLELYEYLAKLYDPKGKQKPNKLPVGFYNLINGGVHVTPATSLKFQELGVIPVGAHSIKEAGEWVNQIYAALGKRLEAVYGKVGIGDEGGYKPDLTVEDGLNALKSAIQDCNLQGKVFLGMDCAASEFFDKKDGKYHVDANRVFSSAEMVDYLKGLTEQYPIISIEDGLSQDDHAGWKLLNQQIGQKIQLVGDDLTTTDPKQIRACFANGEINATLIKLNQIGTLSETLDAIHATTDAGGKAMISHRSGETMDTTIADLAVATGSQIKPGVPKANSGMKGIEVRFAKHHRLLDIEQHLGRDAQFPGIKAFAEPHQKTIKSLLEGAWKAVKGTLIILRHGESTYNQEPARFAGWQDDALLTAKGRQEAEAAGKDIASYLRTYGMKVSTVFSSDLKRSEDTAGIVLSKLDNRSKSAGLIAATAGGTITNTSGINKVGTDKAAIKLGSVDLLRFTPGIQKSALLNERCYGEWEGKTKDEVRKEMNNDKAFNRIRRGYEGQPPGRNRQGQTGESLKMVKEGRTDKFYAQELQKRLDNGENVIIAAHGNSLRALMVSMGIKTPETVEGFEFKTGKPMLVKWDDTQHQFQLNDLQQQRAAVRA